MYSEHDQQLSPERREFLLKDCASIYQYIFALAQMRLAALGASITIMGLLIARSGVQETVPRFGTAAILWMLVSVTVRMVAVLNRAVFVLFGHISSAEAELDEVGFSSYWREYVKRSSRDSASHAFTLGCRGINIVGTGVAIAMVVPTIHPHTRSWLQLFASTFLMIIVLSAYLNERAIRKDLDPRGFIGRMDRDIREAQLKTQELRAMQRLNREEAE